MKAEEFDAKFEAGEDMTESLDFSTARRPNKEKKKVELNLPIWMIRKLENEAEKQGVSMQTHLENYVTQQLTSVG
ncbi:MAG: CopG family transcriptional regulator [Limnothrix sp.]